MITSVLYLDDNLAS